MSATRYNVSGNPLVIDWGTGVIEPGESFTFDNEEDAPTGPDWSVDAPAKVVTAGATGLDDATKAAYTKKSKAADPAPDPAPVADATTPDPAADVPAETKES